MYKDLLFFFSNLSFQIDHDFTLLSFNWPVLFHYLEKKSVLKVNKSWQNKLLLNSLMCNLIFTVFYWRNDFIVSDSIQNHFKFMKNFFMWKGWWPLSGRDSVRWVTKPVLIRVISMRMHNKVETSEFFPPSLKILSSSCIRFIWLLMRI